MAGGIFSFCSILVPGLPSHSVSVRRGTQCNEYQSGYVLDFEKQTVWFVVLMDWSNSNLWNSVGHQSIKSIKSINKEITRPDDQNRIDLLPAEAAAGASGFLLGINQRPKGYLVFHGRPSCVCLCLTYHLWLAYFSSVKILVGIPHRPRTLFSHGLEWWAGWILLQNTGP